MMDAPWPEPALDDLKSSSFTENHIAGRHPDIVEADVSVAFRSMIKTYDREHSMNRNAGRVGRYEYDRLLLVLVGIGRIRLAHDDVNLAASAASSATPPFLPD
jgi:hypothetical protein